MTHKILMIKWGEVELQVNCAFSQDGSLASVGGVFLPAPRNTGEVFAPKVAAATAAMLEAVTVIQHALLPDPQHGPLDLDAMCRALEAVRGSCALKELCRVLRDAQALAQNDADARAMRRISRIPPKVQREELTA